MIFLYVTVLCIKNLTFIAIYASEIYIQKLLGLDLSRRLGCK